MAKGIHLEPSDKPYDWLGSGIYFWENDYNRAMQWAEEKAEKEGWDEPYVLGSSLDLGFCMDLLTFGFNDLLQESYLALKSEYEKAGRVLPENRSKVNDVPLLRYLDKLVLNKARDIAAEMGSPFDSVRGVFWEGNQTYPGAGFTEKNHIQIAIQEQCILGYFRPHQLMQIR